MDTQKAKCKTISLTEKEKNQPPLRGKMSNEIKSTTMLYKRLNFSVSTVKKLRKSLKHSLRIHSKEEKRIQWDENLSHKNIFIVNGERIPMNEQAALSFIKDTLDPFHLVNRTKEQRQADIEAKGKYKYKIKKIIKDEAGNPAATYLEELIERTDHIDAEQIKQDFEGLEISRKAQKLKSVQNYIDLHNTIVQADKPLDGRKTVIQEAFFKFPMHNKVDLSPEFYVSAIQDFYTQYFPDYKIILTVYHGDEIEGKGKIKVGDHPHIFIDCKNKRTGIYDLTEQQAILANKVIETNDFFNKYNPVNTQKQTYQESQIIGEALQELFYQHINDKFKIDGLPLVAEKLEKTQENLELRQKIRLESKKSKEERAFNLYSMKEEQLQKIEEETILTKAALRQGIRLSKEIHDDMDITKQAVANLKALLEKKEKEEKQANKRLRKIDIDTKARTGDLQKLNETKNQLEEKVNRLNEKGRKMLSHYKREKVEYEDHIKKLEARIAIDTSKYNKMKEAIRVINDELEPLVKRFDVLVDRISFAKRLDDNPERFYKDLRANLVQTVKYFGPEKRLDYIFNVKETLKEQGLDYSQLNFSLKEKFELWASDKFKNRKIIEFDQEEKKEAAEARRRRLLKPAPPSPFNDPYDPYK
ncbi:hypothetical protein [Achromobacter ruhlandii]|uniref:hypothetical protein n=1 Tax=Achromobacter ruhlandii TaxID=72557 RepID=UPI0012E1B699|nr:hypothetical protein [Achromobacter ruhlandii]